MIQLKEPELIMKRWVEKLGKIERRQSDGRDTSERSKRAGL